MTRNLLGELEQRVLLSVLQLGDDAYSVSVALHLEQRTGHDVALATIQVALRRIEEKGLAESWLRSAPPDEGGRQRRYFRVTETGLARLREARQELLSLWQGTSIAKGTA